MFDVPKLPRFLFLSLVYMNMLFSRDIGPLDTVESFEESPSQLNNFIIYDEVRLKRIKGPSSAL